jgi:hypothetical protein
MTGVLNGTRIRCSDVYGTGTRGLRIAVHAQELIFLSVHLRNRLTTTRYLVYIGVLIKGFVVAEYCRYIKTVLLHPLVIGNVCCETALLKTA